MGVGAGEEASGLGFAASRSWGGEAVRRGTIWGRKGEGKGKTDFGLDAGLGLRLEDVACAAAAGHFDGWVVGFGEGAEERLGFLRRDLGKESAMRESGWVQR